MYGEKGRTKKQLTLQHLDCDSGARGDFLDAKGGCFHHLTERSSPQWVTFKAKQPHEDAVFIRCSVP